MREPHAPTGRGTLSTMDGSSCPSVISTGLQEAASTYAQIAGLLAGFAFAGIVALITARIGTRNSSRHLAVTYRPLVSAFVGLVAASLSFALVAGDDYGLGRASTLETAAGLGFAVAVLTLIYSLLVLLHAVERDVPDDTGHSRGAFALLRTAFALVICPLAVLVFSSGMRDHIRLRTGTTAGLQGLDVATLVAVLLVLVGGAVAWVLARRGRAPSSTATRILPALSLGLSLVAVLVASWAVIVAEPCRPSSDLLPGTELALVSVFAVVAAWAGTRLDPAHG